MLLGLGRGSGPRSVAGMRPVDRPLAAPAARRPAGDDARRVRRRGPAGLGRPAQRRRPLHPGAAAPRGAAAARAGAGRRRGRRARPDRGAAPRRPRHPRRARRGGARRARGRRRARRAGARGATGRRSGPACCGSGCAPTAYRRSRAPSCARSTRSSRTGTARARSRCRPGWPPGGGLAGCISPGRTAADEAPAERGAVHTYDGDIDEVLISAGQDRGEDQGAGRPDLRRLRRPRAAAGRRAQGGGDPDVRPGPGAVPPGDDGVHGGLVVRVVDVVVRRRADPQGPRPRHLRPARAGGRGHRRLRADPVLAAAQPRTPGSRRRWR